MKKITLLLGVLFLCTTAIFAQKTITGKVTNKLDGSALPGVTVVVKGSTTGTITDADGKYTISVPTTATTLTFTFIGMLTQDVEVGTKTTIDVVLVSSATQLEGMVVTALGVTREKKSLGYSTQEVKGDLVSNVTTDNVTNALSGKVAGIQVTKTTNMGGSTNIILRGNKSLTGDNQVLFVIDGVPVNNENTNTNSQSQAGLGYDYGNAASDINPDDIESVNVLKGAAATALYGSRAANGVIMITTKKGAGTAGGTKKGIGISINSGVTVGFVDKSTFPEYQQDYGAGYGEYYGPNGDAYFNTFPASDFGKTGPDETWVPTTEDASYGAHFDPKNWFINGMQ
jgi:TonB-dependent SusC/RagA subfamily outer membrane receptor